ncbi:sensor histidine kinase [Sulfitobacter sp. JBTF-M27]|uniref:histidine kinase n=2 Tax=Sulfitobacter sediminilitoris TaxID=2698830 RepID=A0A6P0C8J2_9RHOB|nr:histidine kinase dimerization/phosphoacceptor domain -containing protein [Sulfitobacter sediminilitoris]NEK21468.1 sensor histidine kinase [Sulfitobacter sediminilitoris]
MTSGFFSGDLLRGLAFRVLFFLSLALLPIGLIAISQTQQIAGQNRLNAELSLVAITEQAATAEAQILQEAFGAANAVASIVKLHRHDAKECSDFFRAYQEANPFYNLVGFIPTTGIMACSSAGSTYDFSENPTFIEALADPSRRISPIESSTVTNRRVTAVTTPVFEGSDLVGLVVISIPSEAYETIKEPALQMSPLALMTFNRHGEIITSERGLDVSADELPADVALAVFTGQDSAVFEAENLAGAQRVYAIRPIVQDAVFAVSVWPANTPFLNPSIVTRLGAFVPIVMWAASLVVAFWALNRLAIRHIRKLVRQMRRFALNRNLPQQTLGGGVPTELVEMEAAFINMGESILQDEATLEDSLREKNILLKEVHHRVKNNLQLISSIMNMQIRQAKTEDASLVLRRLQERILSLATVHKNLYQNDDLVRVDASVLLHESVNQLLSVGLAPGSNVKVTQKYEPISLEADDAAPLTLLVSEAVTNALKYVTNDDRRGGEIEIKLDYDGPDHAKLSLRNTTGGVPEQEGTGLGSKLIHAFARQLNGQINVEETEDQYTIEITFPIPQEAKQIYDY